MEQEMNEPMTPEQIENFRRVLSRMIGPYALLAPAEQIVAIRDSIQAAVDKAGETTAEPAVTKEDGA